MYPLSEDEAQTNPITTVASSNCLKARHLLRYHNETRNYHFVRVCERKNYKTPSSTLCMDLPKKVRARDRIASTALAAVLAAVAINSFRKGKRLTGALAGAGALALGYNTMSETGELTETLERETTTESEQLHCAACGEPIRPGQPRGPNENDEIVHESCRESVA